MTISLLRPILTLREILKTVRKITAKIEITAAPKSLLPDAFPESALSFLSEDSFLLPVFPVLVSASSVSAESAVTSFSDLFSSLAFCSVFSEFSAVPALEITSAAVSTGVSAAEISSSAMSAGVSVPEISSSEMSMGASVLKVSSALPSSGIIF